jgi:hypothetical protein
MKIPDIVGSLLHKPKTHEEVYLSLYLDIHTVAVSFWSLGAQGHPNIVATEHAQSIEDSWDAKGEAIDRLIGMLEEKTGITDVTKVILGLPLAYIEENGDIRKEIRKEIKELTRILELVPIGFVPLSQAMMYKLKKDEGVPPSVILLGITDATIDVSLYKIGVLAGVRDIERKNDVALSVEEGLKSFTDLEVLPARVLLYGSDTSLLEEIKGELLRHQWTATVNFLHFPKIEIVSDAFIIDSISLAGASELGHTVELEQEQQEDASLSQESKKEEPAAEEAGEEITPEEELEEELDDEEKVTEEVIDAQNIIEKDFTTQEAQPEANVVMVDAESLGFKKDVDILEEEQQLQEAREPEKFEEERGESHGIIPFPLPHIDIAHYLDVAREWISKFRSYGPLKFVIVGIGIVILCAVLYWFLPHATVTILETPQSIDVSDTVTIDSTATIVDAQRKIIPGKKLEKSVSGEKTVPVNGKKDVGDPAKGTVTIYNKTVDVKSFKKGTVIITGNGKFSLDNDIDIASASESIGSITFGKGNVNVTAVVIGIQGNITAGQDFTFQNSSSDIAVARNDNAFTGGTSKQVTVVTRADYDAFIKTMSEELMNQAKQQFSATSAGTDTLIDGTTQSTVTEKVFDQEIDQEATQLHGKLTVTISGTGYSANDVRAFLSTLANDKLPKGYVMDDAKSTITVSNIQIKKDGKITAKAQMSGVAFPALDAAAIKTALAGKSIKQAEEYLRGLSGIAGVEVTFRLSPMHDRLPINKNNISVIVAVGQ